MSGQNQIHFRFTHSENLEVSQLADAVGELTADINAVVEAVDDDLVEATEYEPAVLADWSGTAPSSLQNALDRIAAALGPIA